MADRLADFYDVVEEFRPAPWEEGGRFECDSELLRDLVQIAVDTGRANNAQTGGVALAVDVWMACELRRAGFDADAVWPRAEEPRALPTALAAAARDFKYQRGNHDRKLQQTTIRKLLATVGSGRSTVVGGQFVKEVDVVIADPAKGLELAISTKGMTGSYAKNITNRWEEASGDLLNIRRRFPLAALGFALLVTAPVLQDSGSWARLKDMLRKLTAAMPGAEGSAYDAGCLVVCDWSSGIADLRIDVVPADLTPGRFFEKMIPAVFSRSPVIFHERARRQWLASNPPNAPK